MTLPADSVNPGKIESYLLALAGEYRVCSELMKRGVFATVTYGNRKAVDVYAISDRLDRALKIEVKTGQGAGFVTGITQKGLYDDPAAPDFWVLFHLRPKPNDSYVERFFVLTHEEICDIQANRNQTYAKKYFEKHGKHPDFSKGVDNVRILDVEEHEGQWLKIVTSFHAAEEST